MITTNIKKTTNFPLFLLTLNVLIFSIFLSGCVEKYDRSEVHLLAFSPDGSKLISCDNENMVQIWDVNAGEELYRFNWDETSSLTTIPMNIEWLQDSERFAIMDGLHIRIYSSLNSSELWNCTGSFSYIDVSENGQVFASIFGIWNTSNYEKRHEFDFSSKSYLVDLSLSGTQLLYLPTTGKAPEIIYTSNGTTAQHLEEIPYNTTDLGSIYGLRWSDDEHQIGMLVDFRKIYGKIGYYEWETNNYSLLINKTFNLSRGFADISPKLTQFIYANPRDKNITIYDISEEESLMKFEFEEESISTVAWSPDGSMVAAGSSDGVIKVWNADTGELLQMFLTAKDRRLHV